MRSRFDFPFAPFIWLTLWCLAGNLHAVGVMRLFPADHATSVCPDTPLKVTFDAVPEIGTKGVVRIHDAKGALVDSLDLARPQTRKVGGTVYHSHPILVDGNTASIFPGSGVLAYNATYRVTVDPEVVSNHEDIIGWSFTTKAAPPSADSSSYIISADGRGDFCTVQGAVDFIPAGNTHRRHINIRNGIYQEIVRVSSRHNLVFRGQNRRQVIISYPNHNNLNPSTNTRAMCSVAANDISFSGLTLHNTTPDGGSQAEALQVRGQRCVVDQCDLRSYQDTLLVNDVSDSVHVVNSLVEGDVDFIWGSGLAVFKNCEIKSLSSGGYVCQMRNPAGRYGAVFVDCRFTRLPGVRNVVFARIDANQYPDSSVVLIDCAVDKHISPAAWMLSVPGNSARLRFWEHQSRDLDGALLNVRDRASFAKRSIGNPHLDDLRKLAATVTDAEK